jgi:hypothetical protein
MNPTTIPVRRNAAWLALVLSLVPSLSAAAPPAPKGPYDLKSGHLVQKSDFMGEGTIEVWWDDYGAREARHSVSTVELLGQKLRTEKIEIRTPERTIQIDLEKKTGSVSPGMVPARQDDVSGMSAKLRADYKVEELAARVVAGRTCKGLSMEPMKGWPVRAWTWKGIPMLTQTRVGGGMATIETVSIEEDVPVPSGKFNPPDGISLTRR